MNKSYEDLRVWNKGIELVKNVYVITKSFPREELYGLTNQIRRSAVSVPSNIAEGCFRNTSGEFLQFLGIAAGSLAELKTQLIIAKEIGYLGEEEFKNINQLSEETAKMLSALRKSIKEKTTGNQQPATSNYEHGFSEANENYTVSEGTI